MPNFLKDHGLLIEAMTRARKTIICITNPSSSFHELFKNAVKHNDAIDCDYNGIENRCPFIGRTEILSRAKVRQFKSNKLRSIEDLWYLNNIYLFFTVFTNNYANVGIGIVP